MPLSVNAIRSMQDAECSEVWLVLIDINHASLPAPLRIVNNTEDITSQGNVYTAFPFELVMMTDSSDELPQVQLTIDNVERTLTRIIRNLSEPPDIVLKLIESSNPDTIEIQINDLTAKEFTYDKFTISCILYAEDMLNQRFPADFVTPAAGYVGLF